MKRLILVAALGTVTLASFASFGGRDGLQVMQQEQQSKRVIVERRSLVSIAPEMRASMEECMKTMTK